MVETNNIPPEWQETVYEAIALSYANRKTRSLNNMMLELITILEDKMRAAGKDPEKEFLPEHMAYVARGIRRIVLYAYRYAERNPPTHRKGYGDENYQELTMLPDLIWYNDGSRTGEYHDGDGDGFPDPEPPPEDEEVPDDDLWEWVPPEEEERAQAALHQIAGEMGWGVGDEPIELVRATARFLGGRWGLNGKRGNPNDISGDILAYDFPGYQPQLFDVVANSNAPNQRISWQVLAYPQTAGAVWIAP